MERYCKYCGRGGSTPLHRHHIINGNGKRRACETEQSVIDLCAICHNWVHNTQSGRDWWNKLKLDLQKKYFDMGYSECIVRQLMGGKLLLKYELIYGLPAEQKLLRSKDHAR